MTIQSSSKKVEENNDIDLFGEIFFLFKNKKRIVVFALVGSFLGFSLSLVMPKIYSSTATILPPEQNQSSLAATLGQFGGLSSMAGSISGLKNSSQLYVGLLQSRSIADRLISKFNLLNRYQVKVKSLARRMLDQRTVITIGKDGIITISAEDTDPAVAANLANAYVEELISLTQRLAVTDAAKRRLFFEQQLKISKDKLSEAEAALKQTQLKTGILQPEGQIQAIVTNVAQVKATLASKQVQLASIRSFATERNPQVVRIQQEIDELKQQLVNLEKNQSNPGDIFVPTGHLPESGLEYVRKYRDVKYYETMFEIMSKQYESAKLDEAREGAIVQVVDTAIPADYKTRPRKTVYIFIGGLLGLFVGLIYAYSLKWYKRT